MDAEDAGDPQERRDAGIDGAGLDVLVGLAAHAGRQEHAFLGAVLAKACDADAVADGAALPEEPFVVVGQGWHSTHAVPTMILSQPGVPCILGS